jgi:TldD protein
MIPKELAGYRNLFSDYTELRVQENRSASIALVNGDVMSNDRSAASGVSARVYRNGVWGFASDPIIAEETIKSVISSSTRNARFLDGREKRGRGPLPSRVGSIVRDFSTTKPRSTQGDLIDFLRELDSRIELEYAGVVSRTLVIQLLDMEKSLLTSDGGSACTMIPRSLLYCTLSMEKDGQPIELYDVFGGFGQFEDAFEGPEALHPSLDSLYENLRRKIEGIYPEAGTRDVILDADLAGILSHEAVGHTTEADIVRGGSIAGDYIGREVASPLVTMVDFANTALGVSCPVPVFVDDEGTLATDARLIENGVLKCFLHNRESAAYFGAEPTGNARAFRFSDEPLIRMRNTAILPGISSLEEMIASIDDGYYLMRSSNGQADSTSEFMFGIVQGYEIRGGVLGRALRDTTISGVAFDMLRTVTAVSDGMKWTCSGMCGKKQPIPVGMGGPALKCRVTIGGK